jgi:hypothetical protein
MMVREINSRPSRPAMGRNLTPAPEVGTPRCGVTARAERAELEFSRDIRIFGCAAERGTDSAARCPYP